MNQTVLTIAIVVIPIVVMSVVCFYSSCTWIKYKVNYDPAKEIQRPLMLPNSSTDLERTVVLIRDVDSESGLVGKVIQRME